jgi:hypothetical protein
MMFTSRSSSGVICGGTATHCDQRHRRPRTGQRICRQSTPWEEKTTPLRAEPREATTSLPLGPSTRRPVGTSWVPPGACRTYPPVVDEVDAPASGGGRLHSYATRLSRSRCRLSESWNYRHRFPRMVAHDGMRRQIGCIRGPPACLGSVIKQLVIRCVVLRLLGGRQCWRSRRRP